jgi:hypothetical protein
MRTITLRVVVICPSVSLTTTRKEECAPFASLCKFRSGIIVSTMSCILCGHDAALGFETEGFDLVVCKNGDVRYEFMVDVVFALESARRADSAGRLELLDDAFALELYRNRLVIHEVIKWLNENGQTPKLTRQTVPKLIQYYWARIQKASE